MHAADGVVIHFPASNFLDKSSRSNQMQFQEAWSWGSGMWVGGVEGIVNNHEPVAEGPDPAVQARAPARPSRKHVPPQKNKKL